MLRYTWLTRAVSWEACIFGPGCLLRGPGSEGLGLLPGDPQLLLR